MSRFARGQWAQTRGTELPAVHSIDLDKEDGLSYSQNTKVSLLWLPPAQRTGVELEEKKNQWSGFRAAHKMRVESLCCVVWNFSSVALLLSVAFCLETGSHVVQVGTNSLCSPNFWSSCLHSRVLYSRSVPPHQLAPQLNKDYFLNLFLFLLSEQYIGLPGLSQTPLNRSGLLYALQFTPPCQATSRFKRKACLTKGKRWLAFSYTLISKYETLFMKEKCPSLYQET